MKALTILAITSTMLILSSAQHNPGVHRYNPSERQDNSSLFVNEDPYFVRPKHIHSSPQQSELACIGPFQSCQRHCESVLGLLYQKNEHEYIAILPYASLLPLSFTSILLAVLNLSVCVPDNSRVQPVQSSLYLPVSAVQVKRRPELQPYHPYRRRTPGLKFQISKQQRHQSCYSAEISP